MLSASAVEMPQPVQVPTFEQMAREHSLYEKRLETLTTKRFPSQQEQLEEVQLKKWKLRLKDTMERMRREQHVGQQAH